MANVKRLGNLYGDDRGTGFAGNVWDKDGLSPTITTAQGGMREPMIIEKETNPIRMVRTEEGKALRKAYESGEIHHGFNEHRKAGIEEDGICNTVSTVKKDTLVCEKTIVASRGRNPDNPSDRTAGSHTEQRLEPNSEGICNCLTSVQKDNMVLEARQLVRYRIRKLSPLECWRLMDFSDEDFHKAEEVNSNTQLYKQAGNSIVCAVLCAIFSQLGIEGVDKWNDSKENDYAKHSFYNGMVLREK